VIGYLYILGIVGFIVVFNNERLLVLLLQDAAFIDRPPIYLSGYIILNRLTLLQCMMIF